ncbi:MAG: SdrD B-like domain-containing protein, partial [Lewinella sp.]
MDGSLILGFMDRMGHQMGASNTRPDGSALENYHAGGDILRVCKINGDFFMQGSVGGCANNAANNEGPNGGEFYFQDHYNITTGQGQAGGVIHAETSVGGLALHKTRGEVAVSSYDPFNNHFVSGGINWFNNTSGLARNPGYMIYIGETTGGLSLGTGTFGKANGLGDLELFCDPLPIQIGNYVWLDTDEDGVQDACEDPVTGLPVTLFTKDENGTLTQVAMTTTDATTGEYYFNDVLPDTTYLIVFGNTPEAGDTTFTYNGVSYAVTQDSTGEGTNPGLNDSDAT